MSNSMQSTVTEKKKSKARGKRGFRIGDAKVSSILMLVLATFMVLIMAVGGLGAWFLQNNLDQVNAIQKQNKLAQHVYELGSDMLSARVSLLVAARYQQEAAANNDPKSAEAAKAMLLAADTKLKEVAKGYDAFRKDIPETADGRRLATRIVSSYRPYLDDGIDPMVQALQSEDYTTFYFVNNEFGIARSEAFDESIDAFVKHVDGVQAKIYDEAVAGFSKALIAIGVAVIIGFLLIIIMRMVFGRVVVKPLVEAGAHFDRIAGGDLTQRVEVRSHNEIGVLYEALRRMQESLTRTVSTVRQGVEEITLGSREIFMGNTDLSSRTEQQAASLQETAASMEQLASTVRQNTDNATQADTLAKSASEVAARGGQAVSAVVDT
ncbi:MAG: Tar ligand binding domain-containing protein, partial [Burkholderiaceae bacterium]